MLMTVAGIWFRALSAMADSPRRDDAFCLRYRDGTGALAWAPWWAGNRLDGWVRLRGERVR
jgi:hypothetical protein